MDAEFGWMQGERSMSQGMEVPLDPEKGKEAWPPLEAPERTQLCWYRSFRTSALQNCDIVSLGYFKPQILR